LKPGFFKNEQLAACSPHARLLFAGLWGLADREGRLEDRPLRIKAEVFPFDNVEIGALLGELVRNGLIVRYSVGESELIAVPTFTIHQTPHFRERASKLPPPPDPVRDKPRSSPEKPRLAQDKPRSSPGRAVLTPESGLLTPESGLLTPDSGVQPRTLSSAAADAAGATENGKAAKQNPHCEVFEEAYTHSYGARYARCKGDFVRLAEAVKAQGGDIPVPDWRRAVTNYFATPQPNHTLADLAGRYAVFLRGPLDRYQRPVRAPSARTQANIAAMNEFLKQGGER
jgi:hypothetical protein